MAVFRVPSADPIIPGFDYMNKARTMLVNEFGLSASFIEMKPEAYRRGLYKLAFILEAVDKMKEIAEDTREIVCAADGLEDDIFDKVNQGLLDINRALNYDTWISILMGDKDDGEGETETPEEKEASEGNNGRRTAEADADDPEGHASGPS